MPEIIGLINQHISLEECRAMVIYATYPAISSG